MTSTLDVIEDFLGEELTDELAMATESFPPYQVDELIERITVNGRRFRNPSSKMMVAHGLVRWDNLSDVDQLKRLMLTMERVLVPDPVSEVAMYVSPEYGIGSTPSVRKQFSRALTVLSRIRPFIKDGGLMLYPIDWEPWGEWTPEPHLISDLVRSKLPRQLPETFSFDSFNDPTEYDYDPEILNKLAAKVLGTKTIDMGGWEYEPSPIDLMNLSLYLHMCDLVDGTPVATDPLYDRFVSRTIQHGIDLSLSDINELALKTVSWRLPNLDHLDLDEIAELRRSEENLAEFREGYFKVIEQLRTSGDADSSTRGLDFHALAHDQMEPTVERLTVAINRSSTLTRRIRRATAATIAVGSSYVAYRATGDLAPSALIALLAAEVDAKVGHVTERLGRRSGSNQRRWLSFYSRVL